MTADWVAALVAAAAAAEGRVAADGRVMTPDWAAASAEGGIDCAAGWGYMASAAGKTVEPSFLISR